MKDKYDIREIIREESQFPQELKNIPGCPNSIFIKGNIQSDKRKIAIVGTRKASSLGEKTAYEFARILSNSGFIIVSGLAFGIDTNAHKGALDGNGQTWAVLANGLESVYPASNQKLSEEILDRNGCLISEYPPQTPSLPHQFLLRNRIISGLCEAIIVIEAPDRSGALATAGYAAQQGKEVFVVPGPINSPNFLGSHKLIRDGARLVSSANDILDDLGMKNDNQLDLKYNLNDIQMKIVETIKSSSSPLSVDNICNVTKLNIQDINSQITSLIVEEIILENEQGKYYISQK